MDRLGPVLAFTAVAGAVLALTFFYIWWHFMRRRSVLLWCLAWGAALAYVAAAASIHEGVAGQRLLATLEQTFLVLHFLFMVAGCHDLVHGRLPWQTLGLAATPFFLWALVGPSLSSDFRVIGLSGSVLGGAGYLWASSRFVVLHREGRRQGARLVAMLAALAGVGAFARHFLDGQGWFIPVGHAMTAILGVALSLFLLVMVLEESHAEAVELERHQAIGTLAAGVAHDFNNALAMMLGHAELAAGEARDPRVRQHLEVITRVAGDSAAIAGRLQDVARTRAPREDVTVDLATLVRDVVDISRPRWRDEAQARSVGFDVTTELAHDVCILAQAAELREVLLNLVFNALDAMPSGGSLHLSVSRRDREAVVVVKDTGIGMTRSVRERVFEPYFTTKGERGSGLGMSVVFDITERYAGRIAVESEPGKGTTLSLCFPLQSPRPIVATSVAPTESGASLRILTVDDEDDVRELMAAMLELAGHRVVTASSGAEALELVAEGDFDVMLTDLGMPGMNGWELVARVRLMRPELPLVLATGWGESVPCERLAEAGVSQVLAKPFRRSQLLACVESSAVEAEKVAPV